MAEYVRTALEVENKFVNTKFMLGQIVPGKTEEGRKCPMTKNYVQIVEALGLLDLYDKARDVDERMGLTGRSTNAVQKAKKRNKRTNAVGWRAQKRNMEKEPKKMLSQRGVAVLPAMAV